VDCLIRSRAVRYTHLVKSIQMLIPTRFRTTIAFGIVAVWASLFCLHIADALEDLREPPEYGDELVAQALAMPAEQAVQFSEARSKLPPPSPVFSGNPLAIEGSMASTVFPTTPVVALPEEPSPRARPRLFELLSIYRL